MAKPTLKQVGRTDTSFTFSVSGITGDRSTELWIDEKQEFVTLSNAVEQGYIESFSADSAMNGNITIHMVPYIGKIYPVWKIIVSDLRNGTWSVSNLLVALLRFDWDGEQTKTSGAPFDITAADADRLNLFAYQLGNACGGTYAKEAFWFENISGSTFYDSIIKIPAMAIRDAANNRLTYASLPGGETIVSNMQDIIDNVVTGETCRAKYFNNIRNALNRFNVETIDD